MQDGIIVIQAHETPSSILLSISLKISNQLFESIDREMRPPGLRYSKSFLSSEDPDSVLWKIEDTKEGVLQFPLCLLPPSAYTADLIKFSFPTEVLVFSPPVTDPNCEPKLLRFSNQKGKLALTNTSGDPPQPNEPANESRIKHYSLFNPQLEFQEQQNQGNQSRNQYEFSPLRPLPRRASGDVRYNEQPNRHFFSPNTINREVNRALGNWQNSRQIPWLNHNPGLLALACTTTLAYSSRSI